MKKIAIEFTNGKSLSLDVEYCMYNNGGVVNYKEVGTDFNVTLSPFAYRLIETKVK